jgi:hypothetical protein
VLCGERIAVCSEFHTNHVNKAESYYRLRPYRAENSSLYLLLLTSSGCLWNSNVVIVVLPSVGSTWNSKRHLLLDLTQFYIRQEPATCPYPERYQSSPCSHPSARRSILILSSDLRMGLPSGLRPSGLPTKILYAPLRSPICAACLAHLILDFIT